MQNGLNQPGGEAMLENNVIDLAERRAVAASQARPRRALAVLPRLTPRGNDPFAVSVEAAIRYYWLLSNALWAARASGDPQELFEAVDDIEVQLLWIENAAIRRRYEALLQTSDDAAARG